MKPTLNNYKPFLGKVCTILTSPSAFPIRDGMQHADFFSGLVTEVNDEGIYIKNLNFNTVAFYTFPIVGIVEEQAVKKSDPNFEKVKMEVEKAKAPVKVEPRPVPVRMPPKDFTSIEDMTKMAQKIKATRKD